MAIKKKRKASPDKVRKNPTEQELRIAKRDGFRFPLLAVPNENRLDGKKDRNRNLFVILSFIIPFLLMYTAYAVHKCQPFGDQQILVTDLWHQYFPFLVDYQDKLKHGESLFWSWTQGGGTNYFSLMSYYLASPLNFLTVLLPSKLFDYNNVTQVYAYMQQQAPEGLSWPPANRQQPFLSDQGHRKRHQADNRNRSPAHHRAYPRQDGAEIRGIPPKVVLPYLYYLVFLVCLALPAPASPVPHDISDIARTPCLHHPPKDGTDEHQAFP